MTTDAQVLEALQAKAQEHKLELIQISPGRFEAHKGSKSISMGSDPSKVLDKAILRLKEADEKASEAAPATPAATSTPPATVEAKTPAPAAPKKAAKKAAATPKPAVEAKTPAPVKEPKAADPAKPKKAVTAKAPAKTKPKADKVEKTAASGSIIKPQYKERYKKNKYSCGDQLSDKLRDHLTIKEDGIKRIDTDKLRALAVANDVWKDDYLTLGAGQQRMTIGNRLRAKIAKGEKIRIGNAIVSK